MIYIIATKDKSYVSMPVYLNEGEIKHLEFRQKNKDKHLIDKYGEIEIIRLPWYEHFRPSVWMSGIGARALLPKDLFNYSKYN